MKKNNKWSAIIIWMFLMIILTLWAYVLLAFIIPFAKNTKWIENASKAYYYAYAGVEESLLDVKSRSSITQEFSNPIWTTSTWIAYQTTSSWINIPWVWEWDSDYDNNFWKIWISYPVQLQVWYNMITDWSVFEFFFRVPNLNDSGSVLILSGWTLPVINWTLSSDSNTLMSDANSYIEASYIFPSQTDFTVWNNVFRFKKYTSFSMPWVLVNVKWNDLSWNNIDFPTFYNNNCWAGKSCILKLSVVNPLQTTTWVNVPYLEYSFNPHPNIFPLYYTTIDTSWKSYWFKKNLKVRVPQQTTNQAFDFTLFQ